MPFSYKMVANSFAFSIFECKFNEMKTERLFLVLSALVILKINRVPIDVNFDHFNNFSVHLRRERTDCQRGGRYRLQRQIVSMRRSRQLYSMRR